MSAASYFSQYWPVTRDFGLIEAPVEDAVQAYMRWWGMTGRPMVRTELTGGFGAALAALEPLTQRLTRKLLVGTTSGWTAFFQNGISGSDPARTMRSLARAMNTRALRVRHPRPEEGGGAILEVYAGPKRGGDDRGLRRSIRAEKLGGKWHFAESGARFRFEDPDRLAARLKKDRFTPGMLEDYVERLGVGRMGDALFDVAQGRPAYLFEMTRVDDPLPEYSLLDVMNGVPWAKGTP